MSIVYRTAGAWGAGSGAPLTAAQVDANFYFLLTELQTVAARASVGIANISTTATTMVITMTDDTIYSLQIPVAVQVPAPPQTYSGTTLTLDYTHANTFQRMTNLAGCTVTIPTLASVPYADGTEISFSVMAPDGVVTLVGATGVTLLYPDGFRAALSTQYGVMTCKLVASDMWQVFGLLDLA